MKNLKRYIFICLTSLLLAAAESLFCAAVAMQNWEVPRSDGHFEITDSFGVRSRSENGVRSAETHSAVDYSARTGNEGVELRSVTQAVLVSARTTGNSAGSLIM